MATYNDPCGNFVYVIHMSNSTVQIYARALAVLKAFDIPVTIQVRGSAVLTKLSFPHTAIYAVYRLSENSNKCYIHFL